MSKGNSKSSSKTQTVTTTTTEQRDERVAGTDNAIVLGAGNTGTVNISTLPEGLGDIADSFVSLLDRQQQATFAAGQAAIDAASKGNEDKKTMLIIGAAALAVIALISRF
jgi:hypothetical protein